MCGGLGAGTGGGASSDGRLLQEATTRMADILACNEAPPAALPPAAARSKLMPRSASPVMATVRHVCTSSCGTGTQPSSNASSSLLTAPLALSRYSATTLGGATGLPYSADAVSTERTVCGAAGGMAREGTRFDAVGRWDDATRDQRHKTRFVDCALDTVVRHLHGARLTPRA